MKRLILILSILFTCSVFAQNEELFEQANTAYGSGDYQAAVEKYQEVLESGEASASLYYNLANAHYKLNHIAPSIYFYEKAMQLKPGDQDIKNNIEFARNMAIDDIEPVSQTGFSHSINNFIATFSYNAWAWISILFSVLFVVSFLLYYFSVGSLKKRILFAVSVFSVLLCIVSVSFAYQQKSYLEDNQFAIIFSEEAEVRDEPNLRGDSAFVLHEGTKAKILENYQEWAKIELANGAQGWVNEEDIKKL